MTYVITKTALHRLVDELPEGELASAARYLAYLRDTSDPLARLLENAPEDDEPLTPEEEAAIDEGWRAYQSGDHISAEEAKRELLQ